jgi:hypothetical protein
VKLAVLIPVHDGAGYEAQTGARTGDELDEVGIEHTILLVNDTNSDNTLDDYRLLEACYERAGRTRLGLGQPHGLSKHELSP